MTHLVTHLPTRRSTIRKSVAALLGSTLLAATAAQAVPVQYIAKVGIAGTFLDSPTGTPQVFARGATPGTIATFTLTAETDQAAAAPAVPGLFLDAQFLPVLTAKVNIGGADHPLDATRLELFTARGETDGSRIIFLGAANPVPMTPPLPAYPEDVTQTGYSYFSLTQYFVMVFAGTLPAGTDPAPLAVAGTYAAFVQLLLPTNPLQPPLPFTDGASLSTSLGQYAQTTPPSLTWEVKLLPTTKPFSFFAPVATKGAKEPELKLGAGFSLSTDTNGINPATEVVKLSVGSYSVTVPAGGFKKGKLPVWTYSTAKVNGVQRNIVLTQAGANTYVVAATLDDTTAGLAGVVKGAAADVTLTIGDDTGTKNIIVR